MNVFASHSLEYEELAREFKRCVESIQSAVPVNVYICEEMPGGTKWRSQVRSELRNADLFVLLYPHAGMRLDWCSYELGLYHQGNERPIVCIRNTDIRMPPDITDEWQDCPANVEGIRRFLVEFFVKGTFTARRPISVEVGAADSEARKRLEHAALTLSRSFERARLKRDYYTQRICIESPEDPSQPFDLETDLPKAIITGEERALQLLSLQSNAKWAALLRSLSKRTPTPRWPAELTEAVKSIKGGPIPPPFSPFRAGDEKIYFPVITRADKVDQQLRRIYLIFVEADPLQMQSLFDIWVPPSRTAASWTPLIRSVMMGFRARWQFIVPMLQEARMLGDDEVAARELLQRAKDTLDMLEKEALERDVNLVEIYSDVVDDELQREAHAIETEYLDVRRDMRQSKGPFAQSVPLLMERWITNSTRHLRFVARMFTRRAERLTRPTARSPA